MKICPKCKIEKDESEFSKNQYWCKSCKKQQYNNTKETTVKQYELKNQDKIKAYKNQYYVDNIDYFKQYKKDNADYNKEYIKIYRQINRADLNEYKREYEKDKWDNDPEYKLRKIMSGSIYSALQKEGSSKNGYSCFDYLGYTLEELKEHIEKQFEPWMTWENQGKYNPKTWDDNDLSTWTWNLDHIIPQSKFNYKSMDDKEFRKCWALDNLRPYSAKQNVIEKDNR
jgi:hypothetical protein